MRYSALFLFWLLSLLSLWCMPLTAWAFLTLSYYAMDIESGELIGKKNEHIKMPLASLSKIPSLHYSLSLLGPEYRFSTQLLYKRGVLVLKGGGDPSFTAQQLMSLVMAIPSNKIQTFYVDHSGFPLVEQLGYIGLEDQTDQPSLSSLNIEFNRFNVMRSSDDMIPLLPPYTLKKGKEGQPGPKYLYHEGEWKPNVNEKRPYRTALPSRMPKTFFAEYFRAYASRLGFSLPQPIYASKSRSWKGYQVLINHQSNTLLNLASLAMEYSNNLMAEMPMLTAAQRGSYHQRVQAMNRWLNTHSGLKQNPFDFVNASGIGLNNTLSAQQFTELLKSINTTQYGQHSIWSLFSIGGHSGWIRRRFQNQYSRHRVFAKTGSLYFVKNIAGYLLTENRRKIAFSILTYDPERRAELSKNLRTEHGKTLRKVAKEWGKKSEIKADELIQKWLSI